MIVAGPGCAEALARSGPRTRFECAAPTTDPWDAALEAVRELVAARGRVRARVTLVLSNHFVRYLVLPWQDALGEAAEQRALASHLFRETWGERAEGWEIRVAPCPRGAPRLACAVERARLAALTEAFAGTGLRLHSLQPLLMHAFNRWRRTAGLGDAWFAVLEPGRLCLALLSAGAWRTVSDARTGSDPAPELPGLLQLEGARAAALGFGSERLFACAPFGPAVVLPPLPMAHAVMLGDAAMTSSGTRAAVPAT